jgi:hypothetical protein
MKRTIAVGLFACSLLILQGHRAAMGQDASPRPDTPGSAQSPKWETYKGITGDIKVLRVWQIDPPSKTHEIALAIVSDADFQIFVQDPTKLVDFLNKHHVFPSDHVSEVAHWASLMSPTYPGDPDPWLLTINHAKTCRASITSQPAFQ